MPGVHDAMQRIRAPVSGCSETIDPIKVLWSFKAFLPDPHEPLIVNVSKLVRVRCMAKPSVG